MPAFVATVGYVRSLNIGSLSVWCEGKRLGGYRCDHGADVSLAGYPDDLPVHAIERRLVCTHCGAIGAVDARPNWTELAGASLFPSRS
jgi:hypothetical protein